MLPSLRLSILYLNIQAVEASRQSGPEKIQKKLNWYPKNISTLIFGRKTIKKGKQIECGFELRSESYFLVTTASPTLPPWRNCQGFEFQVRTASRSPGCSSCFDARKLSSHLFVSFTQTTEKFKHKFHCHFIFWNM